jgi:hypothetical protein
MKRLTVAVLIFVLAGCGAHSATTAAPAVMSPAAPGPVSTLATVASRCVMGYIPTGQGAVFLQGTPRGQTISGAYFPPIPGYQLTITDSSSPTADVNGFAVAFYDSDGNELGSDRENVTETFITSGQSLTWTEYSATNASGDSDSFGRATIPSGAAACHMVAWYQP